MVVPLPSSRLRKFKENWIDSKIARSIHGFVSVSKACSNSIENRLELQKVRKEYIYYGISPLTPRKITNLYKELGVPADVFILLIELMNSLSIVLLDFTAKTKKFLFGKISL